MEWFIKVNLFLVILLTQLASIFFQPEKLPYFPIEISRSASSNELSRFIFMAGMAFMFFPIMYSGELEKYFPVWVSVMILAYFDDKNYWLLHMVGVFLLFVTSFYRIYHCGFREFYIAFIALILYVMRVFFKFFTVAYLEQQIHPFDLPYNLQSIFDQTKQIMYLGASVCRYPEITLSVFRITGVMQWCVFYLLTAIF